MITLRVFNQFYPLVISSFTATSRQIRFPENVRGLNGEVLHLKEFKVPLDYLAAKDSKLHELIKKKEAEGDDVWRVETDEDGDICIKIKHYIRFSFYNLHIAFE